MEPGKMVEFKSKDDTMGVAFRIDVLRDGMLAGHIRRRLATAVFRYYRSLQNDQMPTFEDHDLEALKRRVRKDP